MGEDFKKYKASKTSKDNSWDAVTYTRYENEMPVFDDFYVVGVNTKGVIYVNAGDVEPHKKDVNPFLRIDVFHSTFMRYSFTHKPLFHLVPQSDHFSQRF